MDDTISYSNYWKPFEASLTGKQKIFISADGVYHQINLNTIHNNKGKYILERYDLHSVLNARQLITRTKEDQVNFSSMVLMAPIFDYQKDAVLKDPEQFMEYESLPGSLQEINEIANLFKSNAIRTEVFLREAANEINLHRINSPSILHISTHGFFSHTLVYLNEQTKNNFLFHSGIILSPNTLHTKNNKNSFQYDGIVTAYDVMNLNLMNTDLVVLSACETGLGKIANSEGVYGLQRSFLQAGASDILISLWKVEDKMTKDLMVKFYSYLAQHFTRRESFKRAQIDMLREVGNPRQWGGFVMVSGN